MVFYKFMLPCCSIATTDSLNELEATVKSSLSSSNVHKQTSRLLYSIPLRRMLPFYLKVY